VTTLKTRTKNTKAKPVKGHLKALLEPSKTFDDVIERLQSSMAEYEMPFYMSGYRQGMTWASWTASYDRLSALVAVFHECAETFQPITAELLEKFTDDGDFELLCDWRQDYDVAARGFHAGVMEVWVKVAPHLHPELGAMSLEGPELASTRQDKPAHQEHAPGT
jgi:hypothetical protein